MVQFLQKQTNPAFKGLYQANGFDMALLIPYFIVLVILAGLRIPSLPAGVDVLPASQEQDDHAAIDLCRSCRG